MGTGQYREVMMHDSPWWYSSSLCGFMASLIYYWLLAGLGRECPAVPVDHAEIGR